LVAVAVVAHILVASLISPVVLEAVVAVAYITLVLEAQVVLFSAKAADLL
jgi:hypothetical protein